MISKEVEIACGSYQRSKLEPIFFCIYHCVKYQNPPNFLVLKFRENTQFSHRPQNFTETAHLHKISVKLRYYMQCMTNET